MDSEELWLICLKDAAIAAFQSRASVWQTVQAAAIASIPLEAIAWLGRQLGSEDARLLVGASLSVILLCAAVLMWNRWTLERDMRLLRERIERKKPGRE